MTVMNELPAREIGRRLRLARENSNKLRDEVAKVLEVSCATLALIEQGERQIRFDEIKKLVGLYGVSVNALMRPEAVHINLIPRFRRLKESQSTSVIDAAKLLNIYVRAEVELENILGIKRQPRYPDERRINDGNVKRLAKDHASDLRMWLDIGLEPVSDIFSLLSSKMGIRLYQRNLHSSISGLFVYDEAVGACILLNAKHQYTRRVYSAAHELGHFIGTRHAPETFEKGEMFSSREERYADYFAQSFLAPEESFSSKFREITTGSVKVTRKDVILLADRFGVSREFCVRRLEELNLIGQGTWEWSQATGGITARHEKDAYGKKHRKNDRAKEDAEQPISPRIGLMATRAWEQGLRTEGQLVELLGLHRLTLRTIFNENQSEEGTPDDILKFTVR